VTALALLLAAAAAAPATGGVAWMIRRWWRDEQDLEGARVFYPKCAACGARQYTIQLGREEDNFDALARAEVEHFTSTWCEGPMLYPLARAAAAAGGAARARP